MSALAIQLTRTLCFFSLTFREYYQFRRKLQVFLEKIKDFILKQKKHTKEAQKYFYISLFSTKFSTIPHISPLADVKAQPMYTHTTQKQRQQ